MEKLKDTFRMWNTSKELWKTNRHHIKKNLKMQVRHNGNDEVIVHLSRKITVSITLSVWFNETECFWTLKLLKKLVPDPISIEKDDTSLMTWGAYMVHSWLEILTPYRDPTQFRAIDHQQDLESVLLQTGKQGANDLWPVEIWSRFQ